MAAAAVGASGLYSFVITPAMFARVPNPARGEVLAAVFPYYFLVMAVLSLAVMMSVAIWQKAGTAIRICAGIASVLALFNWLYAGPVLRALGEEIRSGNLTDPAHPVRQAFGRWHGISQSGNLTMILCFIIVSILAFRERPPAPVQAEDQ